ncbi:MAG: hypothetical protein KIT58_03545 [Planctomycetota bacterium]|nr:hypothetical protein [Planctomycetota bacterium]
MLEVGEEPEVAQREAAHAQEVCEHGDPVVDRAGLAPPSLERPQVFVAHVVRMTTT